MSAYTVPTETPVAELWTRMVQAVRNPGRPATRRHHACCHGGSTSCGEDTSQRQLACWVDQGVTGANGEFKVYGNLAA
ncbi:MAG TPA: hypothetical protein VH640_20345 [Bryobacteraceae bacterium]